eukprot:scaffold1659_cov255-Pinguiococcus_pyrenoidosus.AAC.45
MRRLRAPRRPVASKCSAPPVAERRGIWTDIFACSVEPASWQRCSLRAPRWALSWHLRTSFTCGSKSQAARIPRSPLVERRALRIIA